MKKFFALTLLFLASSFVLAQDGRTRIDYYNKSSQTVRMLINGNPACTGDVMPGGYCTEPVNPGTYVLSATNGRQETSPFTCTINDGGECNYTVFDAQQSSVNNNPNLRTVSLQSVNIRKSYSGVNATTPMELTTNGPVAGTTVDGQPYTETKYTGSVANGDTYIIDVATYNTPVGINNLNNITNYFVKEVNGTILNQVDATLSGLPAKLSIVEAVRNGRTVRYGYEVAEQGNTAYILIFASWLDVTDTDMNAMETFFSSATIN